MGTQTIYGNHARVVDIELLPRPFEVDILAGSPRLDLTASRSRTLSLQRSMYKALRHHPASRASQWTYKDAVVGHVIAGTFFSP